MNDTKKNDDNFEQLLDRGNKLRQEGKLDKAISIYHQSLELDPNSYVAYHFLGETLAKNNELYLAIDCYKKAIQINPKYLWSYHCLGLVYFWQGKIEDCINIFNKAIKTGLHNSENYYFLGQALEKIQDFDRAILNYKQAIDLNPSESSTIYTALANLMLDRGRLNDLLDYSQNQIKNNINYPELYYFQGKIFELNFSYKKAILSYQKAIEIEPGYWEAYQKLGDIFFKIKQLDEAKEAYQKAEQEFYKIQNFELSDVPPDFDYTVYLALNPELKITSKWQAIKHFMDYGLQENKLYSLEHLHDEHKRPDIAKKSTINLTKEVQEDNNSQKKLAVLVHIYYFDIWSEIVTYINNITEDFDLFVNIVIGIWRPHMHDEIHKIFPKANILISENRGRDIGGHLSIMNHLDVSKYYSFCLLHTKKSPQIDSRISNVWRKDLLSAILGTKEKATTNLNIMRRDEKVGLIGSRYWRSTDVADNTTNYDNFLEKFKIKKTARNCEYLSGTMMLIKPKVMKLIHDRFNFLELESGDGKNLEFHTDGQIAHSLERIIGNLVRDRGMILFWQE